MQKAMSFNDFAIASIKENDYRIYFWYMRKNDAKNIMNNSNLGRKLDYYKFFFTIYKKWVKQLIMKEMKM